MGDTEEAHSERMLRLQSSFGTTSSSKQGLTFDQLNIPQLNPSASHSRSRNFPQTFGSDMSSNSAPKRPPSHPNQIPPLSPYSHVPLTRPSSTQLAHQGFGPVPSPSPGHHSRSMSQPAFFSLDSLPPLSPLPFRDSLPSPNSAVSMDQLSSGGDVSMEEKELSSNLNALLPPSSPSSFAKSTSLPPRKAHRRSNSDIPFGFSSFGMMGGLKPAAAGVGAQFVKRELSPGCKEGVGERKYEGDVVDDLFSAYMNLDGIETLNSSGTDEKTGNENREDLDSRASGSKTNGGDSSDNEAESSVNSLSVKREGMKRRAGSDIAPTSRHYRSVSLDSFMGSLNFGDESLKVPLSPGTGPGQLSPSNSIDGNFSLEFGNGEFSETEMKKIMANDKLTEIALTDPKRVKRILANRQSAARSKERKTRYISELEHKVQTLQTEATTLSAQLTLLQRDSAALTNQNNELKFRLQAMEQQAQLRDALSEALTAEVQRLKISAAEMNGESLSSKGMASQMFQMQQHAHSTQFNMSHHQSPPQQQQGPALQRSGESNQ